MEGREAAHVSTNRKGEKRMKTRMVSRGMKFTGFAVAVAVLCLSLWAAAGVSAQPAGPCAEDAAKFCKGVQPGEGRLAECLKQHANELSPGCQAKIAEAKRKIQEFTQACKDDAARFCKDVKPGGGRIVRCLKEHESELSPACKAKWEQAARTQ